MTNRVTDQTTQNGLIAKFRLEGLMPELVVSPVIHPVVQVASLSDPLSVTEFEKWRSVFGSALALIDPNDFTTFVDPFPAVNANISLTSHMRAGTGVMSAANASGVALPGAGVGVVATDGIYRLTVTGASVAGTTGRIQIDLRNQVTFGAGVALAAVVKPLGNTSIRVNTVQQILFDAFFIVRSTDLVNAVTLETEATFVNGSGILAYSCTKLIDEIPPNVIFP